LKVEFNYQKSQRRFIYSKHAQQLINHIISQENYSLGEISIIFTDNPGILNINASFLKHLYYTDVITFNYSRKSVVSGDIYISLEQVTDNAKIYNTPAIEELFRVIIHGVLHLLGFVDQREEDRQAMRLKEDQYLCIAREIINLNTDESVL
jgi:probable rRNA maturation factor